MRKGLTHHGAEEGSVDGAEVRHFRRELDGKGGVGGMQETVGVGDGGEEGVRRTANPTSGIIRSPPDGAARRLNLPALTVSPRVAWTLALAASHGKNH